MVSMHILHRSHIELIVALPQPFFDRLVASLIEGLDSLDLEVATHASCAIDHLASHFVRNFAKDTPLAEAMRSRLQAGPHIFVNLMRQLFKVLVFDESPSTSAAHATLALVRPLLPVILAAELVSPGVLEAFKEEQVKAQPEALQARTQDEFNMLARDVLK